MTYTPKSEFLHVMQSRSFMQDCTDLEGLDAQLQSGITPAYIGFDATADSLHVGSLIQIMMLRWLQKTGHKPIALMGGGTTKIGDPSGKDESRQLITPELIEANIAGIRRVFAKFLEFGDGPTDAIQPNNADWLDALEYIPFLRDYGRHFTINRMLTMESVKQRLEREQPLTFLEFNYMLLQSYDFMQLNDRYGCALQMGGSDQWGNIVNGIDLTRRINGAQVFGLTTPLLTKADGSKMGKSVGGAIWLNDDKLSVYEYWQFWRNTLDADVGKFLRLFTEIPLQEVAELSSLEGSEINEAKIALADAVTALTHGIEATKAAKSTAQEVFEKGGLGDDLPSLEVPKDGISLTQALVQSGLAPSGKEAKRIIAGGGARLNDEPVSDAGMMITRDLVVEPVKLSSSKKRHAILK